MRASITASARCTAATQRGCDQDRHAVEEYGQQLHSRNQVLMLGLDQYIHFLSVTATIQGQIGSVAQRDIMMKVMMQM